MMKKNKITVPPNPLRSPVPMMAVLLCSILFLTALGGCAFTNRDNTPLLNQVEEHLWPDDTALRVAVFPLVFPAGLAAVLLDAFVVHPATVIGDAAKDTGDILWDNWEWEEHYITECAILPWRAALSPLVFTFDFLTRAFFNLPPRSVLEELDAGEANQQGEEWLDSARVQFDQGQYIETMMTIGQIYGDLPDLEDALEPQDLLNIMTELTFMSLQAAYRSGRYDMMPVRSWPESLKAHDDLNAVEKRMKAMQASKDSLARLTAYVYEMQVRKSDDGLLESARKALSDPDGLVRHAVLAWVDRKLRLADKQRLRPQLKKMAASDPEPLIRAYAGQIVARMKPDS